MAKQIKVIQCPKCGSTDKREIKPDYFVCNNCNTEYYLDNDDITINHNVNYTNTNQAIPTKTVDGKKLAAIFGFLIIMIVLVTLVPLLFTGNSRKSVSGIVLTNTSWIHGAKSFFVDGKGAPIMVIAGTRNNSDNPFVGFVNMQTGKEVKLDPVVIGGDKKFADFTMQAFTDGNVYVIGNKMKIYKVDKQAYTLVDVSSTMMAQHPEMSSGIANAEFIFRRDGEGFKLINNEGKNYFYYPLNDKLYTAKEKQDQADKLDIKDAGEKLVTDYLFTDKSTDFPEDPLQLIQYTKKNNAGGPDYSPWLKWQVNHFGNGPAKTIFLFGEKTVRSWKDLTPGHNYFDPKLLYGGKDFVLYTAAATPAQGAPKILQCVDAATGALKWTMPMEDDDVESVVKCKDGFLIAKYTAALYISNEGKLIRKYSTI